MAYGAFGGCWIAGENAVIVVGRESIHYQSIVYGCILQYTRLLNWRDASYNTLDYCIGGMHLTIH